MSFFNLLDDSKKIGTTQRDLPGIYWQEITKVDPNFTSRKKVPGLKVHKKTVKVIEGQLAPGDETTQVIMAGEYSEQDVRRLYMGCTGESPRDVNELPFATIGERLVSLVGITVETHVTERDVDKDGETKTYTNVLIKRPILPEELASA